ncbi:MAG TPA: DNA-3-methyladenine glycosylase I [Atopostipes sp.]|nr:DNA-3-methyladenine glycosylase I [Atopostipes sp.]
MKKTELKRCAWIQGKPDYYVEYHDKVWGKPEYEDQKIFKWLSLEIFHIGLSWQLVLSKYKHFMEAFDQFEVETVASYDKNKIDNLMKNPNIIRYQRKIEATINNANRFMEVQKEFGSFSKYIWSFSNHQQIVRNSDEQLTRSALSDQVTKDLKMRGFQFVGSVTIYSFLQAIGILNDHDIDCDFR